jgi:acyl-CoA reductase-like NAD-dependent aldehyde dehydrogenase
MNAQLADAPAVPSLAGDQWWSPRASNCTAVYNPSRGEIIARVPLGGAAEVDRALQAAAKAFPATSRSSRP